MRLVDASCCERLPPDLAELGGSTHPRHLAGYYGMVRRLEEALGRIYDALNSTGALDLNIAQT